LEAFLRIRLSPAQSGILFWVMRQTLGWNRNTTPFSWYRIATQLAMDRAGVVRAGHSLLRSGILNLNGDEIGIQEDDTLWLTPRLPASRHKAMTGVSADRDQRKPMTGIIKSDDEAHRNRCRKSALFRRATDILKDIKTYINIRAASVSPRQRFRNGALTERQHPAGAARPIPGKYDRFSQDR
jgi:hypothetical protein